MVARYALIGAAVVVIAALALFGTRRRSSSTVSPPAAVPARSLVIVPSGPDTASHTRVRGSAVRIERVLRSAAGLRVLTTEAPAAITRERLRELLNVGATLYLAAAADGAPQVHAVLRASGDSVLLERDYAIGADQTVMENAIATDVSVAMRARAHLSDVGPLHVDSVIAIPPILEHAAELWRARAYKDAESEFRRAIRIDPQDAAARQNYAVFLAQTGRMSEALREMRRAHELNPLSDHLHLVYALMLARAGRESEAAHERAEQQRIASILHPTPEEHAKALARRRARAAQRQRR